MNFVRPRELVSLTWHVLLQSENVFELGVIAIYFFVTAVVSRVSKHYFSHTECHLSATENATSLQILQDTSR